MQEHRSIRDQPRLRGRQVKSVRTSALVEPINEFRGSTPPRRLLAFFQFLPRLLFAERIPYYLRKAASRIANATHVRACHRQPINNRVSLNAARRAARSTAAARGCFRFSRAGSAHSLRIPARPAGGGRRGGEAGGGSSSATSSVRARTRINTFAVCPRT